VLIGIKNGNFQGDPDMMDRPRQDRTTLKGITTDSKLKSMVRTWIPRIADEMNMKKGYDISIREGAVINDQISHAYDLIRGDKKSVEDEETKVAEELKRQFWDMRGFGGVLNTGDVEEVEDSDGSGKTKKNRKSADSVRGCLQVTFSETVCPIEIDDLSITRKCVTKKEDIEKERTMGSKYRIPHAIYRFHVYLSAFDAEKTGFTEKDLQVFEKALEHICDDHSARSGEQIVYRVVRFRHSSKLGNAPAHRLLERVKVDPKVAKPTCYDDYAVTVNSDNMPNGVKMDVLVS
jgi:CRISPR-associated protein Csd2